MAGTQDTLATNQNGSVWPYRQLDKIYYNPENVWSYGGVEKLLRAAKESGLSVSSNLVTNYLGDQASYSLHKPARKHIKRNATFVGGIDQQWQADLAFMDNSQKIIMDLDNC